MLPEYAYKSRISRNLQNLENKALTPMTYIRKEENHVLQYFIIHDHKVALKILKNNMITNSKRSQIPYAKRTS